MSKKIIKRIYIYIESRLPDGWFQECFECDTITAHNIFFDKCKKDDISWEIYIYICPKCKLIKNEQFINKCHKFIYEKYPEIFKIIHLNILNRNANIIQYWWRHLPVDPNPPAPRVVPGKLSLSCNKTI